MGNSKNIQNKKATSFEKGTLPKVTVEDKIKKVVLRLFQLPEKGLEKAKVLIVKDGEKLKVIVKTDISKLKNDIFHLIHHKHFSKDVINANENTRDFTLEVPPELIDTIGKLSNDNIPIDERIEAAELKLKELGINK